MSAVPRRSPWSHSILRSDVTLNVTLDYSARFVGQGDVAIRPGFNVTLPGRSVFSHPSWLRTAGHRPDPNARRHGRRGGESSSPPLNVALYGGPGVTLQDMERRLIPTTPLGFRLVEHREAILRAAAQRHASNVRVFGSVARGEDRPDSDIDLLVDVEPEATAFDLLALGCDLEEELNVRVDVGTESSLRPFLRAEVLAEALAL